MGQQMAGGQDAEVCVVMCIVRVWYVVCSVERVGCFCLVCVQAIPPAQNPSDVLLLPCPWLFIPTLATKNTQALAAGTIDMERLKKFVAYCRAKVNPRLTNEVSEF
jgi:hypothetical protein